MAFLTINQWQLPALDGTVRGERTQHGNASESWTNRPNRTRSAKNRSWSFTAKQMRHDEADTLEALLDGQGWRFPFDGSLASTNGLLPQGGVGTVSFPGQIAQPPVFGRSHLYISAGNVIWNPGLRDGKWTVMYFRDVDTTAEHVVVRGDGAKWSDGVRDDSLVTTELAVSNGAVSLNAGHYDEMVILPFNAAQSFIEAGAGRTAVFSDLPYLVVDGDIVGGLPVVARGDHGGDAMVQHGSSTGWVNNARRVQGTLEERREYEPQLIALDEMYLLDSAYRDGSGDLRAVGAVDVETPGAGVTFAFSGPFNFGEAASFNGGATANIPLPYRTVRRMVGKPAVSCVAWMRRSASSVQHVLLSLTVNGTPNAKLQMELTAGNKLLIGGRSATAEAFRSVSGATDVIDGEWHMLGGVLDPWKGSISVYLDGELDGEDLAVPWTQTTFDGATVDQGYIGADPAGVNNFNGVIGMVGLAYRRLFAEDFRAVYQRGLKGWFR